MSTAPMFIRHRLRSVSREINAPVRRRAEGLLVKMALCSADPPLWRTGRERRPRGSASLRGRVASLPFVLNFRTARACMSKRPDQAARELKRLKLEMQLAEERIAETRRAVEQLLQHARAVSEMRIKRTSRIVGINYFSL